MVCLSHQSCLLFSQQEVPSYFANVQDQSIYFRKVVSMQGLRNLILFGREIFVELKGQLFSSDPTRYSPNCGLHKMKYAHVSILSPF